MPTFAELDKNSVVTRVVVAATVTECEKLFGGVWVVAPPENYPGPGHTYRQADGRFVAPPQKMRPVGKIPLDTAGITSWEKIPFDGAVDTKL